MGHRSAMRNLCMATPAIDSDASVTMERPSRSRRNRLGLSGGWHDLALVANKPLSVSYLAGVNIAVARHGGFPGDVIT